MTLFYISILFMAVMTVLAVLPLALTVAYERRRHIVTPEEIAGAAASVRPTEAAETELLHRAEEAAREALRTPEEPLVGAGQAAA